MGLTWKMIPLLTAACALLAPAAHADLPLQCLANATVTPTLRSQGTTERVGDILLNCTGGTPTTAGQPVPRINLSVSLNTYVTSRLLGNNTPPTTEALLLVDEPGSTANPVRFPCLTPLVGCSNTAGASGRYNVFQSKKTDNQNLTWVGVPFDPPGSTGQRTLRITNIRANAAILPPGGLLVPTTVVASVSVSGSLTILINNPTVNVGFVQSGMRFLVKSPARLPQSMNVNGTLLNTCGGGSK